MDERATCHDHDQYYWVSEGCPVCDLSAALAEAHATIARLEAEVARLRPLEPGTFLAPCECGMTGPCMWDQCKSPLLKTPAKAE